MALLFWCFDIAFSEESRNPFKNWFPVIIIEEPINTTVVEEVAPVVFVEEEKTFDSSIYTVNGLVWGSYKPKAIINEKIYGIGDRLDEAEISKISKDGVTLIFDNCEYIVTTKQAITINRTNGNNTDNKTEEVKQGVE